MTKSLKQIQKENRKFILEAIHCCSYEEALEKEQGATCEYLYQTEFGVKRIMGDIKDYGYNRKKHFEDAFLIEIIGRPITLDRVLLAFKNKNVKIYNESLVFCYERGKFYSLEYRYSEYSDGYNTYIFSPLFDWDLTSETLEQQTEETQREINKILKGK